MFCEYCGKEIPDDSTFCQNCGKEVKDNAAKPSKEKNMILALIISFILTGLGIAYAGNMKKGIILFIVGVIFTVLGTGISICALIGLLIWAYALYETYNEVKIANGEANPNLINDIKGFPTNKKIGSIIVIAIIFLLLIGGVIGAFTPKNTINHDYSTYDNDDEDIDTDTPSYTSSSSSDDDSYSSSSSPSSDGYDTHSHYDGEYGSSDTYGKVHDDGSVDAYQTGHTDYGDYQIDSHMDSDGNIHGSVNVGGKTYYVNS